MTLVVYAITSLLSGVQVEMPPVTIAPPGGGKGIVIHVSGVEQDPVTLVAAWDAGDRCLGNINCFVSSWIEANASGDLQRLLALRSQNERPQLEARYRDNSLLQRNATIFRSIKTWSFLGWFDYGDVRVAMLVRSDEKSGRKTHVLPLMRVDTRWVQTDALADDGAVYEIFRRIADAVLSRHTKGDR